MTSSLVGSEMCIRDRCSSAPQWLHQSSGRRARGAWVLQGPRTVPGAGALSSTIKTSRVVRSEPRHGMLSVPATRCGFWGQQ
eukprot:11690676-Prorocentrum_lima.AAC.1